MAYDIYPCDLDPFGGCPKKCKDCANCVGWYESEADEQIARQEQIEKAFENGE